MRTNIDLDEALLSEAMDVLGLKTKRATVEEALRQIVREGKALRALQELKGIGWDGDLEAIRRDWRPAPDLGDLDKAS